MRANATIVRVRKNPGGLDAYGDPAESTETRTTMTDWAVYPRTSEDNADHGRNGVIVGLGLLTPYAADLNPDTDTVEVDGDLYEIEGVVGAWKSGLSGWEAGTETALRRAQG